jgi:GNAT superfamily N-acetyltransferase
MMSGFKCLIDTNVVIGLEDARPVDASFAAFVRSCSEYAVRLFVDGASYDDIGRDANISRRKITLSKLAKFEKLRGVPMPTEPDLVTRFGSIKKENDRSDINLLVALDAKAVDFVITQDAGVHRRARVAGLGAKVFTVEEGIQWLHQTFEPKEISLPYVVERLAYELDRSLPIFDSVRQDYPGFDDWFDKCATEHRRCWVLEIGGNVAGIVIRKDETHAEAGTRNPGPKILKICTFKVQDEYRGEKFGEQLLKQILWFAQCNRYDLVYLTAYPQHGFLLDLLGYYGFVVTQTKLDGERTLEKVLAKGPLTIADDLLRLHTTNYPRFFDGSMAQKFCVPIKPGYHRRLFPEIAVGTELPLFPVEQFGRMLTGDSQRDKTPGNTIRKVYLCRAKTTSLKPGDLLFFYMSKEEGYAASQSITSVGVVEQVSQATTFEDLVRLTAKRSVFSADELRALANETDSPVKIIDFLLAAHLDPFVTLSTLVATGIFVQRPPQSIAEIRPERYTILRSHLNLGFDL